MGNNNDIYNQGYTTRAIYTSPIRSLESPIETSIFQ